MSYLTLKTAIHLLLFSHGVLNNRLEWDSPENFLYPAHELANLFAIPKDKRPTGKGIKVGIIDSGIDFTHPALGGCFGEKEGCRVRYGKAYVTANDFLPNELKDTPYDEEGHGTQIAGIIGGNDENILGVAPDVIFGAYKITNATVIELKYIYDAMEQAIRDGMKVIIISSGFKGIFEEIFLPFLGNTIVICSAGNNGDSKSPMSTNPIGNVYDFISVASLQSSRYTNTNVKINNSYLSCNFKIFYHYVLPDQPYEILEKKWVFLEKLDQTNADGCKENKYYSLREKVVIVESDGCSLRKKVQNLMNSKVSGVILHYENPVDFENFDLGFVPSIPIAGFIAKTQFIKNMLNEDDVKQSNFFKQCLNTNFGEIAESSSWGPSPNIDIKPDITAPGHFITTTSPLIRGKYDTVWGTSFSAPYIAGMAALYLEANPKATPDDFRQALMNSAIPVMKGKIESVAKQGAGLINGYGLLMNTVTVSPHKIELGHIRKEHKVSMTITNNGNTSKAFTISHLPAPLLEQKSVTDNDFKVKVSIHPRSSEYLVEPASSFKIEVIISVQTENSISGVDYVSGFIRLQGDSSSLKGNTNDFIHIPYLGVFDSQPKSVTKFKNLNLFKYIWIDDHKIGHHYYHKSEVVKDFFTEDIRHFLVVTLTAQVDELTLDLMDSSLEFVRTLKIKRNVSPNVHNQYLLQNFKHRINTNAFHFRVTAEILNTNFKQEWISPLFLNNNIKIPKTLEESKKNYNSNNEVQESLDRQEVSISTLHQGNKGHEEQKIKKPDESKLEVINMPISGKLHTYCVQDAFGLRVDNCFQVQQGVRCNNVKNEKKDCEGKWLNNLFEKYEWFLKLLKPNFLAIEIEEPKISGTPFSINEKFQGKLHTWRKKDIYEKGAYEILLIQQRVHCFKLTALKKEAMNCEAALLNYLDSNYERFLNVIEPDFSAKA